MTWRRPACTRAILLASTALVLGTGPALAQQTPPAAEPSHDVIVVVGSQIVGARASDVLLVTVVGRDEIDAAAPSSGDELYRSIPQLGDVGFNTSRTIGAVNDARGDTASINLRALGTGNTLVLLNGRRMVNHPGTQAENLVPVVTVNANAIPIAGLDRVEVLLDGASAIYGADAVAGVVNNVLRKDFTSLVTDVTYGQEEGVKAPELSASFEFGINSDDKATNLSITGSYFGRDPIYASERGFSSNADLRRLLPADWAGQSQFDNTSTTSAWGGFDRVTAGNITVNGTAVTNAAGQFHLQPDSLSGCLASLPGSLCIGSTSTRPAALKYDVDDGVTVQNGIDRFNLFAFLNHRFNEHLAFFGEAGGYLADSLSYRETAPLLGAAPIVIPKTNYWNPFGPVGSPNRVAVTNAPADGLDIQLVGYRPVDVGPRKIEVENLSTRLLAGLRGDVAGYDWESAVLYTDAHTQDITRNAVSNTLFQQQLALATPDAYNPFNGGSLNSFQRGDATPSSDAALDAIRISVYRRSETSLASWDFKVSRPDLFKIWSGDVGVAAGVEFRRETYADDRDPRLDGTINFVDPISGVTSSDVMGTSPTNDTKGTRKVASAFAEFAAPLVSPEMHVPLVQNVDLQLAARYENFDRFGDVTKPKVALSWRPFDFLLFRSAWSQGFRAPNLQQLYETGLQRSNVRTDWVRCEADVRAARYTSFTNSACTSGRSLSVISQRAGSLSL
ncbi:MAG: TonB-dependent receptor, partial [Alphaproteobacteria bacterium]